MGIGNTGVEWGAFAELYLLDVLYIELKTKLVANFENYIEANFLAWVMLFEAPASVLRPCLVFDRVLAP